MEGAKKPGEQGFHPKKAEAVQTQSITGSEGCVGCGSSAATSPTFLFYLTEAYVRDGVVPFIKLLVIFHRHFYISYFM